MSIATGYLVLSVPLSIACIVQPVVVRLRLLLTFGDTVSATHNEIYRLHGMSIYNINWCACTLSQGYFKIGSDWLVRCLFWLTFDPIWTDQALSKLDRSKKKKSKNYNFICLFLTNWNNIYIIKNMKELWIINLIIRNDIFKMCNIFKWKTNDFLETIKPVEPITKWPN